MKRRKITGLLIICVLFCAIVIRESFGAEDTYDKIKDGITIERQDVSNMTYEEAYQIAKDIADAKLSAEIEIKINNDTVKTSLEKLGYEWVNNSVAEDALGAGKKGNIIKRYKDFLDIKNNGKNYDVVVGMERKELVDNLKKECEKYDREPKDAFLQYTSDGFTIVPEQEGCELNYDVTADKIIKYVDEKLNEQSKFFVEAAVTNTKPKYTKKDLKKISSIPMGSFSTTFSVGEAYRTRNLNIKNGVEKLNGSVVYPGEEYSCNEHLLPWTEENGWHPAGTYSDGEVVDSFGGGICQVSSTLYNALLNAEITVTERYSHSMAVSYVDLAADAALAEDYKDLKFKNNTEVPIYIQGIYSESQIIFRIYGYDTRPASHSVKYVSKIKKTIPIKTSVTKDPSKPKGYKTIESKGHTGYVAELYKVIYENGEQVGNELLHTSTYRMAPKKIIKGTGDKKKTEEETKKKTSKGDKQNQSNNNSETKKKLSEDE